MITKAIVLIGLSAGTASAQVSYRYLILADGELDGVPFNQALVEIRGTVTDDTDLFTSGTNSQFTGVFAATSIYSIEGVGSIASDAGTEYFFQFQSGGTQYGVVNQPNLFGSGPRYQVLNNQPMADPNVPEATGAFRFDRNIFGAPHTVARNDGRLLTLDSFTFTDSGPNIFITPTPSAATLMALAGVTATRRRR